MVLRKVGAQIWIPTIIVTFGVVTTLTALIKNFGDLMAVRVTLGIAEGGLMPAYLVVLSRFYTRSELVLRTAIFASSACIAGMFGGALVSPFAPIRQPSFEILNHSVGIRIPPDPSFVCSVMASHILLGRYHLYR